MGSKVAFACLFLCVVLGARLANAACAANSRQESVGTLPDIYFTAGTPSTQYIRPVWTTFANPQLTGNCGGAARSMTAGVVVGATYGCPKPGCAPNYEPQGTWVAIAHSDPPNPNYFLYPSLADTPVPIFYDGSSPAGTVGTIDLGVFVDDFSGNVLYVTNRVNIRIVSGAPPATSFVVTSGASNISGDSMKIENNSINNQSTVHVFVQHYATNATRWNHPVAVWYDVSVGRWKIRNEDGTGMPTGLSFAVRVDPSTLAIHTASSGQLNYLIIDDPVANNNPFATVVVTPFSSGNRRMNHPYAVAYVSPHWEIIFSDGAYMPTTQVACYPCTSFYSGFFVKIAGASQFIDDTLASDPSGFGGTSQSNGMGIDIVAIGSSRVAGAIKYLRQFCWTNNPTKPVIATLNQTPLPPFAPISYNWIEGKYYGVGVASSVSTVFHEDGTTMDGRVPFNVWGTYRTDCLPN